MKAERIAELRRLAEHGWTKRERIETLDEIRRLRSVIANDHWMETYSCSRDGYHEEWLCSCGKVLGVGPEAPTARGGHLTPDEALVFHGIHVAALLDGAS